MVLVTGGTGFIGSHLLLYLTRKQIKVRAIYQREKNILKTKKIFQSYCSPEGAQKLFQQIKWIKADITDVTSLEDVFDNVKKVYHVAGKVSFNPADQHKLDLVNVTGTENMLHWAIEKKIQKFLFVSSIATLSSYPQPVKESNLWNWKEPHNDYDISKYLAEMSVWRASQEGLPVVIVNPSVVLGSGFWQDGSGKLFDKVYKGLGFYTSGSTGFIDVWDVVKAMYLLMESNIINESFILSGYNISYKNLLTEISDSLKVKAPKHLLPKWPLLIFSYLNAILPVKLKTPLTKKMVKVLYSHTSYSSEKLVQSLNFNFTPFKVSINQIAQQYIKNQSTK